MHFARVAVFYVILTLACVFQIAHRFIQACYLNNKINDGDQNENKRAKTSNQDVLCYGETFCVFLIWEEKKQWDWLKTQYW